MEGLRRALRRAVRCGTFEGRVADGAVAKAAAARIIDGVSIYLVFSWVSSSETRFGWIFHAEQSWFLRAVLVTRTYVARTVQAGHSLYTYAQCPQAFSSIMLACQKNLPYSAAAAAQ